MEQKTILDDSEPIDPEEERKNDIQFKLFLIFVVMFIVVSSQLMNNKLKVSDFTHFEYHLTLARLYEVKEYIIFFVIMIPLIIIMNRSNVKWAQKEIEKFEQREEERMKKEEEEKQKEFEDKMRGVKFKDE